MLYVSSFEPSFDEFLSRDITDGVQYIGVLDVIKRAPIFLPDSMTHSMVR
jgi:hypothetical protein